MQQQQQQQSEVTNNTNTNECSELKNIKYKSMLLSGVQETKTTSDINNLDQFLENEKTNNKSEPWSKLDKTYKTIKVLKFIETYKEEQKMTDEEVILLTAFLKDCLDRKRLSRVKDVVYDKTTGLIKDIPSLHYNKSNKHFTLKSTDKRISTLKSLPPKKVRCTVKNTTTTTAEGEDSDEEDA
jgi:hypothetical protein